MCRRAVVVLALFALACEEGATNGRPTNPSGNTTGGADAGPGVNGADGAIAQGGDGATPPPGGDAAIGPGGSDGAVGPGGADAGATGCVATETCGNGVDDDCDGTIDQNCICVVGATQSCYGGLPSQAGVGVCTFGSQTCVRTGDELGRWGPCTGDGRPTQVVCGSNTDSLCTGHVDEGCNCTPGEQRGCYEGPAGTQGVGICRPGMQTCAGNGSSADWGPCEGQILPMGTNACDGNDNLCNNMPFSGCSCTPGETRHCYEGPMGTENVGLCVGGTQSCEVVNGQPGWGACNGQVLPAPNTCDGVDRLCNNNPASGGCGCVLGTSRACYDGPMGTAGVGVCVGGMQQCEAAPGGGSVWGGCNGQVLPSPNTCDGVDRLCDGNPLTGCICRVGETRACYSGPANTNGIGICHGGTQSCVQAGGGSDWSPSCGGEQLPAPAEVCGNNADDDCNGATDENCGPSIQCPPDTSTPAGTGVSLTANASSPTGIAGYTWTIVSAPTGGVGTPNQWTPPSQSAQTESFLPFIVGVYTIQITATDNAGQQASCQMNVTSVGHGLRVQLSWDGAGDVDLHLHSPNTAVPWFRAGNEDCYYGNLQPIWDGASPAAQGANPALDFDNVTADGPENTRIDAAVIGVPYTIGVHNYARAAGRVATVEVFCGGVTSPSQVFTSRPLQGASSGDSTSNDFWKVAQVVFTSPTTCTITPIDTYAASSVYNSGF